MTGSINFRRVIDDNLVVEYLLGVINRALGKEQSVLWLIPGGSAIELAVQVAQRLQGNLSKLTLSLSDERYGPVGHKDSNWQQLKEAGLELRGATLHPVLVGLGLSETTRKFESFLATLLDQADYKLGFLGLGADGHTAGILPHSPAVTALGLAVGYDGGQYQRITITPMAIVRLDEVVVYATGKQKRTALDNLEKDLSLADQPAQILKRVPNLTVFNNLKGE